MSGMPAGLSGFVGKFMVVVAVAVVVCVCAKNNQQNSLESRHRPKVCQSKMCGKGLRVMLWRE